MDYGINKVNEITDLVLVVNFKGVKSDSGPTFQNECVREMSKAP